jgi:hypothetical protein
MNMKEKKERELKLANAVGDDVIGLEADIFVSGPGCIPTYDKLAPDA